jgi:hypothetical protein
VGRVVERRQVANPSANRSHFYFYSWDELLNEGQIFDWSLSAATPLAKDSWVMFWKNTDAGGYYVEDSGAGTFGDDFIDDIDEREEWARRFGNLITFRGRAWRCVVDGIYFRESQRAPLSHSRLEAVIRRKPSSTPAGEPETELLEMQYLQ